MAKTSRERDHPVAAPAAAASRAAAPPDRIAVTNMCRNRPILFHFRGGSARLGPLETLELDYASLASPELAQLAASGTVRVSEAAAAAAGPAADRRKSPPDGATEE